MHIIPTDTLYMKIDKEAVRKSGMMMPSDTIPDKMVISLAGKKALYKGDLMMLEMISQCDWTRPIYVASTVGADNYMNLGDNFVQEGLANRITPFTTKGKSVKNFDTAKTYNNLMNRYKYGGLEKRGLYLDETVMRMCQTHRRIFGQLIMQLLKEGKKDKALKALQKVGQVIPVYNVPHSYMSGSLDLARAYALLGNKQKAASIIKDMWHNNVQYVEWYLSLSEQNFVISQTECLERLMILNQIANVTPMVSKSEAALQTKQLNTLYMQYQAKGGTFPEQ